MSFTVRPKLRRATRYSDGRIMSWDLLRRCDDPWIQRFSITDVLTSLWTFGAQFMIHSKTIVAITTTLSHINIFFSVADSLHHFLPIEHTTSTCRANLCYIKYSLRTTNHPDVYGTLGDCKLQMVKFDLSANSTDPKVFQRHNGPKVAISCPAWWKGWKSPPSKRPANRCIPRAFTSICCLSNQ